MIRSMLFIPGNNPAMLMNSHYLGADALIIDLEDAISPDEKDAARILARNALKTMDFEPCHVIARINSLDTPYWEDDLREMVPLRPNAIMPTKVSNADCIHKLSEKILAIEKESGIAEGKIRVIPLIETALAVENSFEIATSSGRVEALCLGAEDLSTDLRATRTKEGKEIFYARSRLVCAARAAGLDVYDTPFTDIEDLESLERDARYAKELGFTGKTVISTRHINIVNEVFSPSAEEIKYAKLVMEAQEEAKQNKKGVVSLDGKMIDAPIVERARLVLEAAEIIEKRYS